MYKWAKLELTLAHKLVCGGVYPDVQVLVQPPPQNRLSCELRPAHPGLYPLENLLRRRLHNLSGQPDLSLTILTGTCLSCGGVLEPTAGNTQDGQLCILDCHQEASSVLPTIMSQVSDSGCVGQEQIFSVENPASRLSPGRTGHLVDLTRGAGPPGSSIQAEWLSFKYQAMLS